MSKIPDSYPEFMKLVEKAVSDFGQNKLLQILDKSQFQMSHYHKFLKMIFHQTFMGPSTFALAAANCDERAWKIRDYLIKHADEEKSHWQWVIEDLKNTGYTGLDPREELPSYECQQYVAFNYFLAMKHPIARLGVAAVLEGIGASYGKISAQKIVKTLNLKPNQLIFIFGHGDTDVGHSKEISQLLEASNLEQYQWRWLCHAVKIASQLYIAMYDEVAKS